MNVATLDAPMADDKPKSATLSVKLDHDVVEAARIVAAFRNETMTDMLSGILRPILEEMERQAIAKRTGERPAPKPKRSPKA
ncbi:MAG: hypothetical protein K2X82_26905 [Gemmataceae bacterium]|nr:hypothetical protein [Gemmataceae bacterium]